MPGGVQLVPLHQQWVMMREGPPLPPSAAPPPVSCSAAPAHRLARRVALRVTFERLLRMLTVDQLSAASQVPRDRLVELETGGQRSNPESFADIRRLEAVLGVPLLPPLG